MNQPHNIQLKTATPEDAPGLLSVYAPYVENTVITFEYELPTAEEFAARVRHTLERYPWLTATDGNGILGYAYASPFKDRAAYAWSAETSIYVREDVKGQGIGSALYRALESVLYRQRVCNLCACIAHPHPESELFHQRFGYRQTAHFHRSGYKNGRWIDMIWMEKELYPHKTPPEPFIPFPLIGFDPEHPEP
ncbi:MAG: GNAT family N-acetyltransferase [Clostridium sp.]|nr:GNAT family N-acetyltransferase [Acetatifactor muris]MCM1525848.1 GNAT family N-acetyltransferase [Bacteroides sp.]MCM1562612.1 GNAT family N-acetyltransferase [Clostridium sp.]